MDNLIRDLRVALRLLTRRPGFTLVAVLALALGIGANTSIFSLMQTVLFRPLPVEDPDRLVALYPLQADGVTHSMFSYPNYVDFRDRNDVLSGFAIYRFAPASLNRNGASERVWGYLASGNYFDVLGIRAHLGRTFLPEEDKDLGTHPVIVISYGCWQRRFAGDPGIVGRTVSLNGSTFTIIGVTPEGFNGTEVVYQPDFWAPVMMIQQVEVGSGWLMNRKSENFIAIARLRPEVTQGQALSSLNTLAHQLGVEYPDANEGKTIVMTPPGLIFPDFRGPILGFSWVLMGVVGLVLLIACTNLAGMLLARATERKKEIAIRLALGASRGRLIRQLLTESAILSLLGGAAGLVLGYWINRAVVAFAPRFDFPLLIDLRVDGTVLAFTLVLSVATGLVFGLAPAIQATRPDLVPSLKDEGSLGGYRRSRLRNALVVAQVALSMLLLIAGGLMLRSLERAQNSSPGFDPDNALTVSLDLGLQGYDRAAGNAFYERLIERVEALPGVKSASLADYLPLSLNRSYSEIHVEGQEPVRGARVPRSLVGEIWPGYFEALRTPILHGREFDGRDRDDATRVAIVNETFVRRFWPAAKGTEEALGKRISFRGLEGPFLEIVGVARDGKYLSIGESPQPFVWRPILQGWSSFAMMVVRTEGDPQALISVVREEIRQLDANLPVFDAQTLREHMGLALFPSRVGATVLGAFGALALLLAAIGVYGVMAYRVAQRTREIGIRMALGASTGEVLGLVLKQGMGLAGLGIGIGLIAALFLAGMMSEVLYDVSALDPVTFVAISALLGVVALLACYLPARRAARVDPLAALRYE